MQAMNASSGRFCREDSSDLEGYDFEPLPTLAEDEENVSLADILSLRDAGLAEQEAWAVCLECGLALRSVAASASALFHTLCITPDTLAFNSSGSICFMEQLSDDPEGAFVPPEYDDTGNTFEAHIYSLGATLKAALEYVAEPASQLSPDLEEMLGRMQAEDPADRPDLQSIMALCEEKLQLTSSCCLCRSLSAAGRRVLSIESFGALPDASESHWRGRFAPKSVEPLDLPAPEGQSKEPVPRALTPKPLLSAPVRNGESLNLEDLAGLFLDAQGDLHPNFLERSHLRKGVSLRFVLSSLGRPFREHELWALSHACLSALSTLQRHPACLCLDSVLVVEDGAVLFGPPPVHSPRDTFFLAPEVTEQRLVTEKASVYCVAAVLWAAAKFSVPRDHKLALPRRLKALLLDMARRSAQERPSAAEAIQVCGTYLGQRGLDGRQVLAHLRASACKGDQEEDTVRFQTTFTEINRSMAPAPHSRSGDTGLNLTHGPVLSPGISEPPASFTSMATHFKPSVLLPEAGVPRDKPDQIAEKRGCPDREEHAEQSPMAQEVVPSPRSPEQPALSPRPQGSAPELHQEPELAQPCPCPPCPALPSPVEGASPVVSDSPAPNSPPKSPPGQGLEVPEASPGALGRSSPHLTELPKTRTPSQEPGVTSTDPQDTTTAATYPVSPRSTHILEQSDQASECKSCLSSVDAAPLLPGPACLALQETMRLIQDEFASDGYLDNGLEALIMGEYIQGLKDLTYPTFCGAISEKFCDLYWGDKLLHGLFSVVNGSQPAIAGTAEPAPSQPQDGEDSCTHLLPGSPRRHGPLHRAGKEKPAASSRGPCPPVSLVHADSDELSQGNLEVGFRPQRSMKAGLELLPGAGEEQLQRWTRPAADTHAEAMSGPEAGSPTEFRSCCPGWRSAFYEADCFGTDVSSYAEELSWQASGSPDTSTHNPELEQQLLIEQRNFRKTLKFYQKLLQKERRGRGSEVKTIIAKLKGQLEDMRSRVHFLGLVQRYLQASDWGCLHPQDQAWAGSPTPKPTWAGQP
ncbi:kinase non-catalytic C-lobe domain-containing protein 1 isoform X1 [Suncus etruscus]|uniref:kinase non-catalytic C-lobe domain-containing protein 1 isoform X1 n=1 Tax=Suncus etruscus TaxID=109475 RepID=UPI00211028EF|nr:kinase non-catalytic C-lobe domain-containing protein 1 isoform X1 [Suncus etruscus]